MWFLYSIAASLLWGLDYALAEKLLKTVGFPTVLAVEFFAGFITMVGFSFASGTYKLEIPKLFASLETGIVSIAMIAVFVVAHVFIVISIGSRNATLASLIEMSYPVFVAGFSWIMFKEGNLTFGTAAGGVLIFAGVALIYFLNR